MFEDRPWFGVINRANRPNNERWLLPADDAAGLALGGVGVTAGAACAACWRTALRSASRSSVASSEFWLIPVASMSGKCSSKIRCSAAEKATPCPLMALRNILRVWARSAPALTNC
ncbi:hypothetical protein ALP71_200205 [Pseudomonas coronafaciens pv. garcae]|nr:hypothetical protein ALP71_200205 [Pseudomonas coronafaciens pv. garcae]